MKRAPKSLCHSAARLLGVCVWSAEGVTKGLIEPGRFNIVLGTRDNPQSARPGQPRRPYVQVSRHQREARRRKGQGSQGRLAGQSLA